MVVLDQVCNCQVHSNFQVRRKWPVFALAHKPNLGRPEILVILTQMTKQVLKGRNRGNEVCERVSKVRARRRAKSVSPNASHNFWE